MSGVPKPAMGHFQKSAVVSARTLTLVDNLIGKRQRRW